MKSPQQHPEADQTHSAAPSTSQPRLAQQASPASIAIAHSPRMTAQRKALHAAFGPAAAPAQLQGDVEQELSEEVSTPGATTQRAATGEDAPNLTGMPNQLKSGIEALSGMDMSDVRVHRNSHKPAQLSALAYAQGNDIHLEPGQEKQEEHLGHEAWHVVRQRQGRVRETVQMAGVGVIDEVGLEREADLMGGASKRLANAPAQLSWGKGRKKRTKSTISGHGKMRESKNGRFVKITVKPGCTVIRAAPVGATLGDISMDLNELNNPDPKKLRKKIKISTTSAIWTNKRAIRDFEKQNAQMTVRQKALIKKLIGRTRPTLNTPDKISLARLEQNPEFEQWAKTYVTPHTFETKNSGESMEDMVLEPFEPKLRSTKSSKQNEYIKKRTFLSDELKKIKNKDILINSCADHPNARFTGFQIDRA